MTLCGTSYRFMGRHAAVCVKRPATMVRVDLLLWRFRVNVVLLVRVNTLVSLQQRVVGQFFFVLVVLLVRVIPLVSSCFAP